MIVFYFKRSFERYPDSFVRFQGAPPPNLSKPITTVTQHFYLVIRADFSPVQSLADVSSSDWVAKLLLAMNEGVSQATAFLSLYNPRAAFVRAYGEAEALALNIKVLTETIESLRTSRGQATVFCCFQTEIKATG